MCERPGSAIVSGLSTSASADGDERDVASFDDGDEMVLGGGGAKKREEDNSLFTFTFACGRGKCLVLTVTASTQKNCQYGIG